MDSRIGRLMDFCELTYKEPYWVDEYGGVVIYGESESELKRNLTLDWLFKYPVARTIKGGSSQDIIANYRKLFELWIEEIAKTADVSSFFAMTYPKEALLGAIVKVIDNAKS